MSENTDQSSSDLRMERYFNLTCDKEKLMEFISERITDDMTTPDYLDIQNLWLAHCWEQSKAL